MSDPNLGPHLSDAELLAALDGELSSAHADRVARHLESCWTCRSERDRVEAAIADVVQYSRRRASVLPAPSAAGRAKIVAHLREHGQHTTPVPSWRRVANARRISAYLWSAQPVRIAAIAASIALLVWPFIRTDEVSASELLVNARQAEVQSLERVTQPVVYQRVQIRAGSRTFVRTTYRDTTGNRLAERIESGKAAAPTMGRPDDAAESANVRRALEAAGRDWAALLSATEYEAWRTKVSIARESVSETRGTLVVNTTTARGAIAESTLTLRINDYHPIAEAIQMRDETRVEITELAHEVLTLSALQSAIFGPEPSAATKAPIAPTPAARPAIAILEEAELDVRLALRESDADLTSGVDVRRTSRHVEVIGHLQPESAAIVRSRLGDIPLAVSRVTSARRAETRHTDPPLVIGLEPWRIRTFGDAATGEAELRETYALAERVRARTDAYHAIGRRYSDTAASQLPLAATEKLAVVVRAHHAALVDDVDALDRKLAVLLGSTPRRLLESEISDTWRDQAAHASAAAGELLLELRGLVARFDLPMVTEKDALIEPAEVAGVRRALTTLWTLFERRHSNR